MGSRGFDSIYSWGSTMGARRRRTVNPITYNNESPGSFTPSCYCRHRRPVRTSAREAPRGDESSTRRMDGGVGGAKGNRRDARDDDIYPIEKHERACLSKRQQKEILQVKQSIRDKKKCTRFRN